jgi:hypothetical protein
MGFKSEEGRRWGELFGKAFAVGLGRGFDWRRVFRCARIRFVVRLEGIAGPIGGTLPTGWFLNEVKNLLQRPRRVEISAKLIRYKQKAALERKIGEMGSEGWKPKWESYRETEPRAFESKNVVLRYDGEGRKRQEKKAG